MPGFFKLETFRNFKLIVSTGSLEMLIVLVFNSLSSGIYFGFTNIVPALLKITFTKNLKLDNKLRDYTVITKIEFISQTQISLMTNKDLTRLLGIGQRISGWSPKFL